MEYRVPYRDIPWGVAFCVLPGKIIGRCILDPIHNFVRNWKSILAKWAMRFIAIMIVLIVLILLTMLANTLTDGAFLKWIFNGLHDIRDLFTPADPQTEARSVIEQLRMNPHE